MFEVTCGNCQGRLLVQQAGVVVACPHCGTHLTIGGPPTAPPPSAPAPNFAPAPVPQPQYAAPPQPVAPPPQYAPQPQYAPPPQPQYAPQPAPQNFAPTPAPAPQPQFAPAPQPVAPVPQQYAPPQPIAPQPAPVPAPAPVMEQPAAPQFFVPPEPEPEPGYGHDEPVDAASWMTPAQPAVEPVAAVAPTLGEPMPFLGAAPVVAEAPTMVTQFVAPAPTPVEPAGWGQPVPAAPQPTWGQPAVAEVPAAPTYAQAPAPAPVATAAPTWGAAPTEYAPAPSYQPSVPDYSQQPQFQPQQQYGQPSPYGQQPAEDPAVFGAAAASAQPETYGLGPTHQYSAPAPVFTPPVVTPAKPIPTVPRGLFFLLLNYASLATVLALWFGYQVLTGAGGGGAGASPTDSLPDIEPRKAKVKGKETVAYVIVPTTSVLANHQVLAVGETRKFGHLEVTPTKVSQGRIEFVNSQGGTGGFISPPAEVLKLHLSIKNTSKDQSIAPFRGLAFKQVGTGKSRESNIFVCPPTKRGRAILAYPVGEQERIKGLEIDRELKPGESCELFIPTTDDGLSQMLKSNKDFVWRVHMRKGYSPKQFGVTTLFEVSFDKDKIDAEA